jgi:hypothetical protein
MEIQGSKINQGKKEMASRDANHQVANPSLIQGPKAHKIIDNVSVRKGR